MLSDEQIEQFRTEGYVVLPDLFTPSEVALLGAEASTILAADRPEVVREKDGRTARTAFAAHTYNDAFARLARHPRLIQPAMELVDGPVYIHQFKINAKAAFDGDVWQWHQDYGTWAARDDLMPEPRALNVALFLEPVTACNGPLMFIPRSHRQGKLEAGHDLTTTSYPLWTPGSRNGGAAGGGGRHGGAHRLSRHGAAVRLQSGPCIAQQYFAVEPNHRLYQRLPCGQSHPAVPTPGIHRPSRFHAD